MSVAKPTIISKAKTAGSNLLIRRNQKSLRLITPVSSYSFNKRLVIKNPDITKKVSTPKKPPISHFLFR